MFESGEGSQSDNEAAVEGTSDHEEQEEKEKTDQSQQTTPTTPPNDSGKYHSFLFNFYFVIIFQKTPAKSTYLKQ